MKRLLATTTALAMTAGAASAQLEVTIGGFAEMGLIGGSDIDTQFVQDIDIRFDLSGESDNGLTFGSSIDLDEDAEAVGTDDAGVAIFLSGNFGTVTMGDTDGAMDWAITESGNVANPGSIQDDETAHFGYLGSYLDGSGDGQIVRYDYSFDQFSFAVSVEQPNDGATDDLTWAIGFGYQFEFAGGSVDLGVGYQNATVGGAAYEIGNSEWTAPANSGVSATGISGAVSLDSGFSAGFTYTTFNFEGPEEIEHIGIGAGYSFDAFSLHANYGQFTTNQSSDTSSGFGLAAGYDLGGGLSVEFGYGSGTREVGAVTTDLDQYSFGLSMDF